jgi:hypothetical protein
MKSIAQVELNELLESWGNGIIKISDAYNAKEDYKKLALEFVQTKYCFDNGPLLFKPTMACDTQFRGDIESTLSYFIGGNSQFPEDNGFALRNWSDIKFDTFHTKIFNDIAICMGNYFFTNHSNETTKVEYSIGFKKDLAGNIKINLHHSSFPYSKD